MPKTKKPKKKLDTPDISPIRESIEGTRWMKITTGLPVLVTREDLRPLNYGGPAVPVVQFDTRRWVSIHMLQKHYTRLPDVEMTK